MAQILNGTPVSVPITPGLDDANTFPTHLAKYGQGGFELRLSLADVQTISPDRRSDKLCYALQEKAFYRYDTTTSEWVEVPVGSTGVTDDVLKVLGVTVTPTRLTFDRELYTKKLITDPSTVELGSIDVSGAGTTIATLNRSNGSRSLNVGVQYKDDGTTSLRSYTLSPLVWHDRQLLNTAVQPISPYRFKFTIPETIIRTALMVIPSEEGTLTMSTFDAKGNMVAESQEVTFTSGMVNHEIPVQFRNHAVLVQGDTMLFELKGARLRGAMLPDPVTGALQFVPFFRAQEHLVTGRPSILTEDNASDVGQESVALVEPRGATMLPTGVFNVVAKYSGLVGDTTQGLPDLTITKSGAKLWVENLSSFTIRLTPAVVSQTIQETSELAVARGEGVMLVADTVSKMWIPTMFYSARQVRAVVNVDGGVVVDGTPKVPRLDGGITGTLRTRFVDAGHL